MNSKVFLHNKENIAKIIKRYLICLIPLVLYGLYKNGFLLYSRDLISLFEAFKIIILLLISIGIYFLVDKLIFHQKKFWTFDLLYLLIIPLFMPPNINIGVYTIGLFVSFILANLIEKKFKFNKMAFCKLIIILLVVIFSNYSYANAGENLNIYSLNLWDNLWGRNIGGIASTNIILGLLIFLVFCITNNYKTIVATSSLVTFIVISLCLNSFDITVLTNSSAILGLILLSIDSFSTPHTKKGMLIYGILAGLITALLTKFVNLDEGVFISTLFLSFFASTLDKILEKW